MPLEPVSYRDSVADLVVKNLPVVGVVAMFEPSCQAYLQQALGSMLSTTNQNWRRTRGLFL